MLSKAVVTDIDLTWKAIKQRWDNNYYNYYYDNNKYLTTLIYYNSNKRSYGQKKVITILEL